MDPRDLPEVTTRSNYKSLDSLRKWWASLGQDSSLGGESFDYEAGLGGRGRPSQPPRPTPGRAATMPAFAHRKAASEAAEIRRADAMPARPAPRPPRAQRTAVLQTSAADKFLGTAATAAGRHREERLPRFIIHPLSPAYRAWWYLTVFVAALTAILVPYVIAFTPPGLYPYDSGTSIVEYMCIALIAADTVVSFNVARYVNGELVADRRQLAKNYTRLIFWVDLLSIIPFDEIALACAGLGGPNYVSDPVKAQYLSLLKFMRMLRMYRLSWFFSYLTFNLAAPLLLVTLLRNLFYTFFLANIAACAFYFVALQQGLGPNTWVGASAMWMGTDISTADMYIWSLYWSLVTLSTTGYGDIRPYNPVEAGLVSIYVLFVFFYAAYIIGSITLIVVKGDDRVGRYRDQMRALQSYAALHSLPGDLRESMMRHLKLHFYNAEAADETVLKVYPSSIRRRVLRQLYMRTIRECYLFAGAKPRFLDALLAVSRVELYLPMVEVVSQGDYVNELFILAAGRVACVSIPGGPGEQSAGGTADEETPVGVSGYFRAKIGGYTLARHSYVTSTIAEDGSVRGGSVRGSSRAEGSAHGSLPYFEGSEAAKVLEEGEVFGEVAFFTGTAQTETVVTMSACRVLAIARPAFEQVAATFPTSQKIVLMHLARHGEDTALELFPGPVGLDLFTRAMAEESRAAPMGRTRVAGPGGGDADGTAAFTGGDPTWRLAPGRAAALRLNPAQERAVGSLLQVKGVVSRAVAKHDADRTTEWLYAAARGDLVKVNEMIGHGFDPDAADYDHRTALMLAAGRGHREVVDALLAAGASLNARDAFNGTAMLEACRGGHDEIIDVLKRAGGGLAVSSVRQGALLCAAVQEGDLKLLRRLIRAGANVDAADYDGRTALHLAASKGNVPAVEVLVVEGGADLGRRDNWGATAAEEARRVGARACETFLVAEEEALRAKERVKSSAAFGAISEEEFEEEKDSGSGDDGGGGGSGDDQDTTEP